MEKKELFVTEKGLVQIEEWAVANKLPIEKVRSAINKAKLQIKVFAGVEFIEKNIIDNFLHSVPAVVKEDDPDSKSNVMKKIHVRKKECVTLVETLESSGWDYNSIQHICNAVTSKKEIYLAIKAVDDVYKTLPKSVVDKAKINFTELK